MRFRNRALVAGAIWGACLVIGCSGPGSNPVSPTSKPSTPSTPTLPVSQSAIQTLVGNLSAAELIGGLGMQALWVAIGSFLVWVCFRASVKHYTAVGN